MKLRFFLSLALLAFTLALSAQKNLAEMLGYDRNAKLLIIHADDMGLSQSVNTACIEAFRNKWITSGSIMMPCPWSFAIFDAIKTQTGIDAGIHLTLTAEWALYKWDGVTSSDKIKSLLDENGFFYPSVEAVGKHADVAEALLEMSAQVNRAVSLGITPTHIDTHMGSVLAKPELVMAYLSLSEKYRMPVLFPRAYVSMLPPETQASWKDKIFLLDNLLMLDPGMIKGSWPDTYKTMLSGLKPGLNQLIVHIAYDNDEMKAISKGHDDYGSKWRQNDLDLIKSKEFSDLLKANNVVLISWGQIKNLMK